MLSEFEFWIEAGATATVMLLIPVYMGFIHVSPIGAAAYAAVGGFAMAVGEELQFRVSAWQITAWDIMLWCAAIAGAGGLAYLLALIFI